MRYLSLFLAMVLLTLTASCGPGDSTATTNSSSTGKIKIGFVVKQPEEKWFQNEWKFAQQAAEKDGFELVPLGAVDGSKVLNVIDSLSVQGVQGFIICTPDVRLGPVIVENADKHHMKVMSVDDQFLGPDGNPMADVHHMGISAREIGRLVGRGLAEEMKKRGWKPEETAACIPTRDELPTAKERTEGAKEALIAAGFPKDRIFSTGQKTTDIAGGFDAATIVLTQNPDVKNWLIAGMNDEAVMGAVRATESRKYKAANIIAIGIGGDAGKQEFEAPEVTGFFATALISPKRHGYETADMMYKWIKDGVEPPKATYTSGILITRENYKDVMKDQGLM